MTCSPPRWFILMNWWTLAILIGTVAFTATGFTGSIAVALVAGCCLAAAVSGGLLRHPGPSVILAGVPPAIQRLFAVGAPLLIGQLLFAATFIIDPGVTRWEEHFWMPMRSAHSCVSAYWVAGEQVHTAPDIYADSLYSLPQADPTAIRVARLIGPLGIEPYEYPPPFLVLPRLITAVAGDFWSFRRIWFGLTVAIIVAGLIVVARRFDRMLGTHSLWLTPFALLPPAMIGALVIGNVQLAVIAASMLAMVLFERGHRAAGGALLAYAIVSTLYPGLLVFYLLLRREWRAVTWTVVMSAAIVTIAIADFGTGPYLAFLSHLPKLQRLGGPHMGFASKVLGSMYTIVVIVLVAWLARRPVADGREPLVWLAVLTLATLGSPFLPTYAPFPSVWLATLLAALTRGRPRLFTACVVLWGVVASTFDPASGPPIVSAVWTFMQTIAAFVLVAMAMRVATARAEDAPPIAGPRAPRPHEHSLLPLRTPYNLDRCRSLQERNWARTRSSA